MIEGREQLNEFVRGKSDDELYAGLETEGETDVHEPGGLLERIMQGMLDYFDSERAAGQSAVIQYEVIDDDKRFCFQVHVESGNCSVTRDLTAKPRVTLSLTLPNHLRLVTGQLIGMHAFMSGKLMLSGDKMFARWVDNWFPH